MAIIMTASGRTTSLRRPLDRGEALISSIQSGRAVDQNIKDKYKKGDKQ